MLVLWEILRTYSMNDLYLFRIWEFAWLNPYDDLHDVCCYIETSLCLEICFLESVTFISKKFQSTLLWSLPRRRKYPEMRYLALVFSLLFLLYFLKEYVTFFYFIFLFIFFPSYNSKKNEQEMKKQKKIYNNVTIFNFLRKKVK